MTTFENDPIHRTAEGAGAPDSKRLSRRGFLGRLGGAAAATMASGMAGSVLSGLARPANAAPLQGEGPEEEILAAHATDPGTARRLASYNYRMSCATYWKNQPVVQHLTNGDETRYPSRIGNYSKALPHNSFGEVDPTAYASLLNAVASGKPADYDGIVMGGPMKLTNPQAGLAFDLQGADSYALGVVPPPPIASGEMGSEGVENYWMALLRDVNFLDYSTSPDVAAACADLNRFGADFKGPKVGGKVLPKTLFRDPLPGNLNGPYISQFMWLNTPFGVEYVERKIKTVMPGTDHLTGYDNWLATQNGDLVESFAGQLDPERRYIRNGRDLAMWVHIDILFQAYFNACLILIAPPNDDPTASGLGCTLNPGNPYLNNANQSGFATFGAPAIKGLMCEVANRALKVTWHKKWQVNRRLRPEEWGGLVHNQKVHSRFPGVLDARQLNSPALDRVFAQNGTYLMPMAFPEGCPTHPSYTAGHATVAGACVTILKAMFDENYVILNPVIPTPDGLSLERYHGPNLTVGGELNKLASNVATGRNLAGVHWRSDARESLKLGETLAISILRDQKACYNEIFQGYTFTKFDGTRVTV
ncbi:MAG TPA: vanadium-dependent haloperoxidase [Thermoanaerobaculia bacterium]|jgi:hypothetical protein